MQVNGVDATNLFNGMTSSGLTSQRYNFNIGGGSTSSSSLPAPAPSAAHLPRGLPPTVRSATACLRLLPSPLQDSCQHVDVRCPAGRNRGAQIDVNTKTGTNNWHGQV